jgi:hypothetical protein
MTGFAGFNPAETHTSAERIRSGKAWALGNVVRDHNYNEWMYVQASAATSQYAIVAVKATGHLVNPFASAEVGGTAGAIKALAVAASASIAADSYGWVMTKGRAAVKCIASGTGTFVPTAAIYAAATAGNGLVTQTASAAARALSGMTVAATATTSTVASTIPVVFYNGVVTTA